MHVCGCVFVNEFVCVNVFACYIRTDWRFASSFLCMYTSIELVIVLMYACVCVVMCLCACSVTRLLVNLCMCVACCMVSC